MLKPVGDVVALSRALGDLIDTGIFCMAEAGGPLFRAALTWMTILLHELHRDPLLRARVREEVRSDVDVVELVERLRYRLVHLGAGYAKGQRFMDEPNTITQQVSEQGTDIRVKIHGADVLIEAHLMAAHRVIVKALGEVAAGDPLPLLYSATSGGRPLQ